MRLPFPAAMSQFEIDVIQGHIVRTMQRLTSGSAGVYLEIGSRYGGSLHTFGMKMPQGSRLLAVDMPGGPWGKADSWESLVGVANMLQANGWESRLINGDSKAPETVKAVREAMPLGWLDTPQVDVLFIDGDHSLLGVASDIANYWPMVKPGGMAIFHDCGRVRGVEEAENQGTYQTMANVRGAFEALAHGKRSLVVQELWGLGVVWKNAE